MVVFSKRIIDLFLRPKAPVMLLQTNPAYWLKTSVPKFSGT